MQKILLKIIRSDNAVTLGSNVINAFLGFVSFVLLAHWMGRNEFGLWLLYLTAFNFMEMLRAGMLHQAIVHHLAKSEDEHQKKHVIGSAWVMALVFNLLLCLGIGLVALLLPHWTQESGLDLFFKAYPLVIWFTLPMSMAQWIQQAEHHFLKMGIIILMGNLIFLICLGLACTYSFEINELAVFLMHTFSRLMSSLLVMLYNWSHLRAIRFFKSTFVWEQFHFGKFSVLTLIGTNLLKSADIFIIGFFMGPVMVAVYSLPLKLIEIAEMPLRAMTTTAFPKFSKLFAQQQKEALTESFNQQVFGFTTLLLIPFVAAQLSAEPIILILGGRDYLEGVWVLRIFMVFIFFLPLDRLSGILLDSIGKPQFNSFKVFVMVLVNILGDLAAVYFFQSINLVALVTILNVLFGIWIALWAIKKHLPLKFKLLFSGNVFQQLKHALYGVFM